MSLRTGGGYCESASYGAFSSEEKLPNPAPVHRVCADEKKKDPSSADAVVADNAPASTAAPGTAEPVVTGLASGSMTVAVPRSMTASLPSFLRLLASHADATYSDAGTLVKEWGISNSTCLEFAL